MDGVETVLGVGVIDLTPGDPPAPELVLVDESSRTGVG